MFICVFYVASLFYVLYYGIYVVYYGIKALIYACIIIWAMISELVEAIKRNKTYNNSNNYKSTSKKGVKILGFDKKRKNGVEFPYILVRIEKTAGRKIFNDDSINSEEFGIDSLECPMTFVDFDNEKDYKVEIDEDSNALACKLLDAMFKKLKRKMTVEIGKNENDIKYRYYYTDEGVMINRMNKDNILRINSSLRDEYIRIKNGIANRSTLDDDPDLIEEELKVYNIDINDFYNVDEYLSNDYLIYEWFYIEQLLSVLKNIDLTVKSKPLVFERVIEYEDERGSKKDVKSKNSSFKKKSQFDKEADLWGLSKEDRRIAKDERMSPADYVEAEENDDDELLKDDWDR